MSSDDTPSGIRSVSVGFGASPQSVPDAAGPPTYRILVAGDFGLAEEGAFHRLAGRDIADLLGDLRPAVTIEVENRLGSHPATVSETVRLAGPKDLRPAGLRRQLQHVRVAQDALAAGDAAALGQQGQRYDLLVASQSRSDNGPGDRTGPVQERGTPASPASDGLESLFDMVDVPDRSGGAPARGDDPARLVSDFIAETVRTGSGSAKAQEPQMDAGTAALLADQTRAFLEAPGFRRVLENWFGLRLLLRTVAREPGLAVSLVQISTADPGAVEAILAEDGGVLDRDCFDIVVFVNRCSAVGDGAETLKALAASAETFGTMVLAGLTADFAGVPADTLATMDAPHQMLDVPGFETFTALRRSGRAANLGVIWNDVLADEPGDASPAYYYPAAWIAAVILARNVVSTGWPRLVSAAENEPGGFPVAIHQVRGREIGMASRVPVSEDCAESLASAGIATLSGRIDRDSVCLVRWPSFRATGADRSSSRDLDDRLVVARLNQVMQTTLPDVLRGEGTGRDTARRVEARLDARLAAMAGRPRCEVVAESDETSQPVLNVTIVVPAGIAASSRFEFQVPLSQ